MLAKLQIDANCERTPDIEMKGITEQQPGPTVVSLAMELPATETLADAPASTPVPSKKQRGRPPKAQDGRAPKASASKQLKRTPAKSRPAPPGARRSGRVSKPAAPVVPSTAPAVTRGGKRGRGGKRVATSAPEKLSKDVYVVEAVLDSSIDSKTGEHLFLVKWEGYGRDGNTWEPKANMGNCGKAIRDFQTKTKNAKTKKR